jgi:hypothetical protein
MLAKSWWVTLLAAALIGTGEEAAVKLEWKFNEGDVLYFEAETVQKQELEFTGKPFKQTEKLQQVISLTVKEKTASGIVVEKKIEKLRVQAEGNAVGAGDAKLAEKLSGATFTLTLDTAGRISKFEGYDAFIKKLADGNADAEKVARVMLPEDVLRNGADEFFRFLPLVPVKKDTGWKREETLPMGPLGSLKSVTDFTYDGKEKEGDVISAKTTVTYMSPPAAGVFKITKGSLKSDDAKGRYVFDADKGRLVQAQRSMTLKGTLTIDFMGKQADMAVAMDLTHTLRAVEKKPAEK